MFELDDIMIDAFNGYTHGYGVGIYVGGHVGGSVGMSVGFRDGDLDGDALLLGIADGGIVEGASLWASNELSTAAHAPISLQALSHNSSLVSKSSASSSPSTFANNWICAHVAMLQYCSYGLGRHTNMVLYTSTTSPAT